MNADDLRTQTTGRWDQLSWLPLTCIWALMLATFSAPGREGPSTVGGLDVIALLKLAVRGVSLVALGLVAVELWNAPRRPAIMRVAVPLVAFSLWVVLSCAWSPLKAVSAGQAAGFLVSVQLALVIGILYRDERTISTVLFHLVLGLFLISTVLVVVDRCVSRDLSGLDRSIPSDVEGYHGIYHPTAAGSTGSLGLILLITSRLLWGWRWTRILLAPGTLVFAAVVFLAASRTAAFLTVSLVAAAIVLLISTQTRAMLLLAAGLGGALYIAVDPDLRQTEGVFRKVSEYVERGEAVELLTTFTGRTDMWEAMWASYWTSPVIGHGYFVSSSTGSLDVWTGPANWTAHNILLQVLVTTGLIGFVLFVLAFGNLALAIAVSLAQRREAALGFFLGLLAIWYAGWGSMSEAFMGPLRPENVVFFAALGLGLGRLPETFSSDDAAGGTA